MVSDIIDIQRGRIIVTLMAGPGRRADRFKLEKVQGIANLELAQSQRNCGRPESKKKEGNSPKVVHSAFSKDLQNVIFPRGGGWLYK